ncbi:MAG: hypothetical protein F4Y89_10460 [Gammaproteobacteria bacterium]|nr:hypothetical protein [Gammaproteobacteria bacterium]
MARLGAVLHEGVVGREVGRHPVAGRRGDEQQPERRARGEARWLERPVSGNRVGAVGIGRGALHRRLRPRFRRQAGEQRQGKQRGGDRARAPHTHGSARLGSARLGSARLGSARRGAARLGSARLGSARLGSARLEANRADRVVVAVSSPAWSNAAPIRLRPSPAPQPGAQARGDASKKTPSTARVTSRTQAPLSSGSDRLGREWCGLGAYP